MKTIILFFLLAITINAQSRFAKLGILFDNGVSFTPASVTSATSIAWYDFSDADYRYTTITRIDSLTDKFGLQNRLIYPTPFEGSKPTLATGQNGLSVGDFVPLGDGSDYMKNEAIAGFSNVADEVTIFIVAKFEATNGRTLLEMSDGASVNRSILIFNDTNTLTFRPDGANSADYAYTDVINYKIFTFIHTPALRTIYVNGTSVATNPTTQNMTAVPTNLFVGVLANSTTYPMDGKIGEIIIYRGAISSAERLQIETYLNTKWAIY